MNIERSLALELINRGAELKGATLVDFVQLTGDMSSRRYYRMSLQGVGLSSAIFVRLAAAPGPVGGGVRGLTQDDTYVEVSSCLSSAGVRVPRILVDARDRGALVLEDVGSISLLDVVRNPDSFESISDLTTGQGDLLYELFSRALSLQTALQRIVRDDQLVVFQRQLSQEQRAVQIREFLEHYANPRGLSPHAARVTQRCMDTVCAHVAAHPLQVSHFDFMAANIHVLPDGELCLIDFQDMCLDSPARDIVSLLNDRGLDEGLGRERQQRLLSFFMSRINQHQEFARLYDEYLLLWDFRVAGRFALLADSRGVERYRAWIPSTLRRLGRTLARTQHRIDGAAETLQALSSFSPEVAQGGSDPWGGIAA